MTSVNSLSLLLLNGRFLMIFHFFFSLRSYVLLDPTCATTLLQIANNNNTSRYAEIFTASSMTW